MGATASADPGPVRVLLVDDHPVLRDVVRMACDAVPGLKVVGEAEGGAEALEACRHLEPDVLVLDLMLPDLDGFEVARRLREEGSPVRILALTARADREAVFECIRLGLEGYLEKTAAVEHIAESIAAVARGERVYTQEQERLAIAQLGEVVRQAREVSELDTSLTDREREVLVLISRGLTIKQVASRLGLSQRTVESHVSKLYRKLDVRTRVQAVARAASLGLVELEPRRTRRSP